MKHIINHIDILYIAWENGPIERYENLLEGDNMKRISTSIVIAITACVLIVSLLVGGINGGLSYSALKKESEDKLEAMSMQYSNQINLSYQSLEAIVSGMGNYFTANYDQGSYKNIEYNKEFIESMANYISVVQANITDLHVLRMYAYINPIMSYVDSSNLGGSLLGAVYENGERVDYDPEEEFKSFQNRDNEKWNFYNETMKNDSATWLTPYMDEELGCKVISYTQPIYAGKKAMGVVGLIIPFEDFENIVTSITPYENGYAFLIDSDNRFIVHNTYTNETQIADTEYRALGDRISNSESGTFKTKIKGEQSYVVYNKLENGYNLVIVVPVNDVLSKVFTMLRDSFLFILICVVLCIILACILGRKITRPIQRVTNDLAKAQNGDFTSHEYMAYMKKKDETGMLARALNSLQHSMKVIVSQVDDNSNKVSSSTQHLTGTINSLVDEVVNITSTVEELSASMQQTESTAITLNESSERIIHHINSMDDKNHSGVATANEISERAISLKKEAITAANKADEVSRITQDKLKKAIEESKEVNRINELTKAILEISDQTSLLSLNASIEAARAGEFGRGFSVVADEIRSLADNSQNTALQIQEITKNVIISVNKLCESAYEVLNFMDANVKDLYNKLILTSEQYNDDSMNMRELFESSSNLSKDIFKEIESLLDAFAELTDATTEGVKGIQCISDNTEDVSSHTRMIEEEVNQLSQIANNLASTIEIFTVI